MSRWQLSHYLPRPDQIPAGINVYPIISVVQYMTLIAFWGHLIFLLLFWQAGVIPMVLFNIGSCTIFLICYISNQNGRDLIAIILGPLEVVVHAIVAVRFVGWNSGFHFYLLGLVPILFYLPMFTFRRKIIGALLLLTIYLSVYLQAIRFPPTVQLNDFQMQIFAVLNTLTMFLVLAATASFYHRAVYRAEEGLTLANQKLELWARTDPLTGLCNRRKVLECLEEEASHFERTGRPFSVVLCDVDHFKQYNDQCGHDLGDAVLVAVTESIQKGLRKRDIVARWGGDEFLILLPDTNLAEAEDICERLRKQVQGLDAQCSPVLTRMSMTFGVSLFFGDDDINSCLRKADQALLAGKRDGKNRVVVASERLQRFPEI